MPRGKKDAEKSNESCKEQPPARRGGFQKGQSGNPAGRKPGTRNKITNNLREAILTAFEGLGGAEWLKSLGKEKPREFCTLLAKVIPAEPPQVDDEGMRPVYALPVVPLYLGDAAGEKEQKFAEYMQKVEGQIQDGSEFGIETGGGD